MMLDKLTRVLLVTPKVLAAAAWVQSKIALQSMHVRWRVIKLSERYPDSARRARAQGTTFLKLRVLATGKVGEVFIEKSAGRSDLDEAAADAV